MHNRWFATFPAGFGPLVARLVARDLPGSLSGDSLARAEGSSAASPDSGGNAIFFSCETEPRAVLSYCRSLFRVLGQSPGGLDRACREFARILTGEFARVPARGVRGPSTFVLRAFGPDDPASLPYEMRRELESAISRATGMRPDSRRPDREFRVQERAGGTILFLERAAAAGGGSGNSSRGDESQGESTRRGDSPRRGELPRTTCRLLAEMTDPGPEDVFLDPFCGYGGIALERALASPYRFVFASDIDPEKVAAVKASLAAKAFERRRRTIFPKVRDALDETAFEPGFVTAMATDPPWGVYEGGMGEPEARALLGAFMSEAARVLAPGGRLVLLVSRALELESGPDFAGRESLEVLVSGKKARAIRLDRL